MRSFVFLLLLVAVVGLPASALAHDKLTGKDIEGDLELQARILSPKQVQPGERIDLRARIVNTSTTHTHKLVRPGDGSESGWREPRVFLTAELQGKDGRWRKVAEKGVMRCGNFDANWHDEVFELKPAKATKLESWFPPPAMVLDLSKAGRYRITAHYAYSAKAPTRETLSPQPSPGGLGKMKGVPKFELKSKPVEVVIARDLEIHLKVLGKLKPKTPTLLSELLEVKISNETQKPIEFRADQWNAAPQFRGNAVVLKQVAQKKQLGTTTLRAGETLAVLGKGRFAAGRDFRVTTEQQKGFVEVAVLFTRPGGARYTSAFVKIPLAE